MRHLRARVEPDAPGRAEAGIDCGHRGSFVSLELPAEGNHTVYRPCSGDPRRGGVVPMIFFWSFVVGGLICVIGQLLMDVFKLTPAHTTSTLVVAGAILDGLNLYEPLIDFAGAGATVPITSFGNALVHGAMAEAEKHGLVGVITGIFEVTSAGISAAIIFGFIAALLFRPKG